MKIAPLPIASLETPNIHAITANSSSKVLQPSIASKIVSTEAQNPELSAKILKIIKTSLAGVGAIIYGLTAGLVISVIGSMVFSPALMVKSMRNKACSYVATMREKNINPHKSMMFYKIRQKSLPMATLFRKPTEDELKKASAIAQVTQTAEFDKFKKRQIIKYSCYAGVKYTTRGLVTLPYCFLACAGMFTYSSTKKAFKTLNK